LSKKDFEPSSRKATKKQKKLEKAERRRVRYEKDPSGAEEKLNRK